MEMARITSAEIAAMMVANEAKRSAESAAMLAVLERIASTLAPRTSVAESVAPIAETARTWTRKTENGHIVPMKVASCGHPVNAARTVAVCKRCLVKSYRSR